MPVQGLQLLAPVIPSKIVCVGKNYRDHAAEMGGEVPDEPLLFLKPSSSVIGPGEPIRLPVDLSAEVHHEAELAVVIGALLQRVTPEQALAGIFGYTAANDVTARDLQRRENQWFRGKGFDTFCPLGPAIATDLDPSDLRMRCSVDGEVRQDGTTADLVWGVAELISEISQVTTLLPSDVDPDGHAGRCRSARRPDRRSASRSRASGCSRTRWSTERSREVRPGGRVRFDRAVA